MFKALVISWGFLLPSDSVVKDTISKDTVYHELMTRQRGIEVNQVHEDIDDIYYALQAIEYYLKLKDGTEPK